MTKHRPRGQVLLRVLKVGELDGGGTELFDDKGSKQEPSPNSEVMKPRVLPQNNILDNVGMLRWLKAQQGHSGYVALVATQRPAKRPS